MLKASKELGVNLFLGHDLVLDVKLQFNSRTQPFLELLHHLRLLEKSGFSSARIAHPHTFTTFGQPTQQKETMSIPESIQAGMTLITLASLNAEDQKCAICWMPMKDANKPHDVTEDQHIPSKLVVCGHTFERNCITYWLQSSTTCPCCRTVVYFDPSHFATYDDDSSESGDASDASESDDDDPERVSRRLAARTETWVSEIGPSAIRTVEALLQDNNDNSNHTAPAAAIARRALNLILQNTLDNEYPTHYWWWMTWMLPSAIRHLSEDGWAAYINFLEHEVIAEWEATLEDDDSEEENEGSSGERDARVGEKLMMIKTIKDEVDACRRILGWEAFPRVYQ